MEAIMRIYSNPPARKRAVKRKKKSSLRRRGPAGQFIGKARRKSMATKRRKTATKRRTVKRAPKRRATKRKSTKRSHAWYVKIGRKGAATRRRKKAARSAAARKASRSRKSKPKYRARGRKTRPTLYKRRGKYYASPGSKVKGRRINPRRRKSRKGRRRNPGLALSTFLPTRVADFKSLAVLGAGGTVGWLGVSMVNGVMNRFGVANLKAKVTSPGLASVVNALQSAVSTFIVAGLVRKFVKKPEFAKAVFIGGAAKTVHSLVVPYLSMASEGTGVMADMADAALSGYQEVEMAGFQERLGGFREYADTGMGYIADGLQAVALANAEGAGNAFGL
jgi:hypothetical protein